MNKWMNDWIKKSTDQSINQSNDRRFHIETLDLFTRPPYQGRYRTTPTSDQPLENLI